MIERILKNGNFRRFALEEGFFMENIIEIKNLHKSFGEVHAVNGLSINVKKGQLYAFLGLNGAGKSTTISIMCGHETKDSGQVFIDGIDLDKNLDKVKSEIGVVFQFSSLDKVLTVYDNLSSRASLYGLSKEQFNVRLTKLDELLNIKCLLKRTFGKLSGGEKRRVDFARAMLNKPKILILDEPTTGLDPQTRKMVWNVINQLRKDNQITVFLTTHYMEETTDADYVVILDKGKIVGEGTPIELKNKYTGDFVILYNVKREDVDKLALPYKEIAGGYKIFVENTQVATKLIKKYDKLFVDYEIIKGNMDDVFLAVTGKDLKESE